MGQGLPRRFNPRPSLLTGEPQMDPDAFDSLYDVSIHARHC